MELLVMLGLVHHMLLSSTRSCPLLSTLPAEHSGETFSKKSSNLSLVALLLVSGKLEFNNGITRATIQMMMNGRILDTLCRSLVTNGTRIIPMRSNMMQRETPCDRNGVGNNSNVQVYKTTKARIMNVLHTNTMLHV